MFTNIIFILVTALAASPAMAKIKPLNTAESAQFELTKDHEKLEDPVSNIWVKGKDSIVKLKGQQADESTTCRVFKVQLSDILSYQIDCAGHEKKARIDLKNTPSVTVTQKGPHTTITKYNFLIKKPQVSQLRQSVLKVPYVEQIIHIKKNSNGELSFYFESFRVDEFGRIVQDGFIQAHSLSHKKLKISAN